MKQVRILQNPDATGTDTWTVTATLADASEVVYTFAESEAVDVIFDCESLEIDRTGGFTTQTVEVVNLTTVCLRDTLQIFRAAPDLSGAFACFVFAWAWLTYRAIR